MHLVVQCSNCGANVKPELGVVTATTFQHRDCADRFGIGTEGRPIAHLRSPVELVQPSGHSAIPGRTYGRLH